MSNELQDLDVGEVDPEKAVGYTIEADFNPPQIKLFIVFFDTCDLGRIHQRGEEVDKEGNQALLNDLPLSHIKVGLEQGHHE